MSTRAEKAEKLDRFVVVIPWILAFIFGSVAIHLSTLLALPTMTPNSAYFRLAANVPLGEVRLLPRATPENSGLPYSDPFAFLATCRFDLAEGPLRLRATADGDHPLSVSVRLANGAIIYSGADNQTHGRFNILIATRAQADAVDEARDALDDAERAALEADELRLVAPQPEGFVMFRLLALRQGEADSVGAQRDSFTCKVEKPSS
jgi:uncharacterized membrane protein